MDKFSTQATNSVGFIYRVQGLLTMIGALIARNISTQCAISFLAGSALVFINFWLHATFWKRVLDKKPVALTLIIVITKYTILGVLLFFLVNKWRLQFLPLLAGTTMLLGSFLALALRIFIIEKKKDNAF